MKIRHHAFVIKDKPENGIEIAREWLKIELGMGMENNPDIVILRHGLLSVDDARNVCELAAQAPFAGSYKAIIVSASRAYHEAQNALLKLFEEPPPDTYLFLILPTLGGLLPTLRSRVQVLNVKGFVNPSSDEGFTKPFIHKVAEEFMKAGREKRSAMIKKLTSGKDEDERRELREDAIDILNGVEAIACSDDWSAKPAVVALLRDIQILRGYLYDRSAPVRMILEHLSLVIQKNPL